MTVEEAAAQLAQTCASVTVRALLDEDADLTTFHIAIQQPDQSLLCITDIRGFSRQPARMRKYTYDRLSAYAELTIEQRGIAPPAPRR